MFWRRKKRGGAMAAAMDRFEAAAEKQGLALLPRGGSPVDAKTVTGELDRRGVVVPESYIALITR